MMREAEERLTDATHLTTRSDNHSDSAYLLELLAFELLLKAAVRIDGQDAGKEHNYQKLFHLLDSTARQSLISTAIARSADAADYSDVDTLLEAWSKNFVSLRYPFEKYEGLTEAEYLERGEKWVAAGATPQTADFVYHPIELHGFVFALDAYLQRQLRE